jgi:phosphatidylserine/phosphatidylglycerophosphate/cardiolipin synthase-like enzyme
MIFMLLEKEDKPNSRSSAPFVALNASNNVYKAHGSRLPDKLYQWTQETNARLLEFNHHVSYIHSKFLLMDPLSVDPIVVSGSANFSNNSTKENDENMLIIRGNKRVADIYLTEFNRLFNHYYFRSVVEATMRTGHNNNEANLFLAEKPEQWLSKYKPGKFKQKKLDHYTSMKGFE